MNALFATDLHGRAELYERLFALAADERPGALFLGGDLLPGGFDVLGRPDDQGDFLDDVFLLGLARLRDRLGDDYPAVFVIPGNDDPRAYEAAFEAAQDGGLFTWLQGRRAAWGPHTVYGYGCVPPTPFLLKDWERYDVSRFVDVGAVSPEEGWRSVEVSATEVRYGTIAADLERLAGDDDLAKAIFLFHAPPYRTDLDRAALDLRTVDHVPVDVHVGSIAVRRFIEARQPLLTLHGHVHESVSMTGHWSERLGRTWCFGGAHDGPELCVVRFDPGRLSEAERVLYVG